mmetsp:Transcript_6210/g.14979  ORF Transcript_6210/g.14979 Transcript_6210/m.14979 type:complete len:462 (-) Transcript_6210:218-1603(-)
MFLHQRTELYRMHEAKEGADGPDEGPDSGHKVLPVDNVDHNAAEDNGGYEIVRAQKEKSMHGVPKAPPQFRVLEVDVLRLDGERGPDQTLCLLACPVRHGWHKPQDERGVVALRGDGKGVAAHDDADEHKDGVQRFDRNQAEDHCRQAREADHEECHRGQGVVRHPSAHRFEGRVPDEHGHSENGPEACGDHRGGAVAEHRRPYVEGIPCQLGELHALDGADGDGETDRDDQPDVRGDLARVLEDVGDHELPGVSLHVLELVVQGVLGEVSASPSYDSPDHHHQHGGRHPAPLDAGEVPEEDDEDARQRQHRLGELVQQRPREEEGEPDRGQGGEERDDGDPLLYLRPDGGERRLHSPLDEVGGHPDLPSELGRLLRVDGVLARLVVLELLVVHRQDDGADERERPRRVDPERLGADVLPPGAPRDVQGLDHVEDGPEGHREPDPGGDLAVDNRLWESNGE